MTVTAAHRTRRVPGSRSFRTNSARSLAGDATRSWAPTSATARRGPLGGPTPAAAIPVAAFVPRSANGPVAAARPPPREPIQASDRGHSVAGENGQARDEPRPET